MGLTLKAKPRTSRLHWREAEPVCVALTPSGQRCQSRTGHVGDRCWLHLDPRTRLKAGFARDAAVPRAVPRRAPKPDPEPLLRLLPRLPTNAEVIERLRSWAVEFDELDPERYTAAEFLEWVELEHLPRRRERKAAETGPLEYEVIGPARALLYG